MTRRHVVPGAGKVGLSSTFPGLRLTAVTGQLRLYAKQALDIHAIKIEKLDLITCWVMLRIIYISIYKLGDVGITSNLIGSLFLTNGHCQPPGRWIMKNGWPA